MKKEIYKDYEAIKQIALHYAKEHKCNYNVIIHSPNEDGTFGPESTYEFVTDSYFEKERPFDKIIFKTDDEPKELAEIIEQNEYDATIGKLFHVDSLIGSHKFGVPETTYSRPDTYVREQPKIGRNDTCMCGSGKKYKNCCLKS